MLNSSFLQSIDLFHQVDEETLIHLADACSAVKLKVDELLIPSSADSTDLYLLESGQLEIYQRDKQGIERIVKTLHPGQYVGETGLLTGTATSVIVKAAHDSTVHLLTRAQFARIADSRPALRAAVESAIYKGIQAANLSSALYENHILGKLDIQILNDLQNEIQLVLLNKGDQLIARGEPSDSLYIVVNGQLRVFEPVNENNAPTVVDDQTPAVEEHKAQLRPLVDIGRGQTVGEIGLLTGEPRNASVYALRGTLVGRLDSNAFYRLLQKHPKALTRLFSSQILGRLVNPQKKRNRTFALVGINACGDKHPLPLKSLAMRLCWHIENPWLQKNTPDAPVNTVYIDENFTERALGEPGISTASNTSAEYLRLQNWLNEQEANHDYLFLGANYFSETTSSIDDRGLCTPENLDWINRIVQQVDHVIYVVDAKADIDALDLPPCVDRADNQLPLEPGCSIVLLHPENRLTAKDTHKWLSRISVDSHHHIRWSDCEESDWNHPVNSDVARVSRLLTGRGIGLVLSGGAARGFAHIGVVRALHEAGVPIDLFGGASAGAISASIIAAGHTDNEAHRLVMKYGKRKNMNDYTLPSTSLFKGKRFSSLLRSFVGDVQIEDLWNPFYCVSINLTNASEVVHRRGPLWKYVRASASMPIILPPVADKGQLLADGAMLNAMPVEIMSNEPGCGTVFGIDVSSGSQMHGEFVYGTELSGWAQLIRKFNPFAKPYRSPALSSTILAICTIGAVGRIPAQQARADLYIRPSVNNFRMMDYDSREEIMDAGYRAAKAEIAIWLEREINA